MPTLEPAVRATARACALGWRRLQADLADLGTRVRDAVIDVLTRSLSATAGEALHCLVPRPRSSRPPNSYPGRWRDGDDWDDDDIVMTCDAGDPPRPAAGRAFVRTAAWWLWRRGALWSALAAGLAAGAAAWLGAGEVVTGVRQVVELVAAFAAFR
jgi:hypothetical protein